MPRLVVAGALTLLLAFMNPAAALGPAMGLDAQIGQLDAGFYDSDPASNAPNAGGIWTDLTGSNFVFAPSPSVRVGAAPRYRVIRAPRITVTP
jgi:hypothetical protein